MKKATTVKGHSRKGKKVRTHVRKTESGNSSGNIKPGPVNSQGNPSGADYNNGLEEAGPDYHGLADKLKSGSRDAFRPMMEMAKSRKSAGITKASAKDWNTTKSADGRHFVHTHKSGKTIKKKNPNWIKGDSPDSRI